MSLPSKLLPGIKIDPSASRGKLKGKLMIFNGLEI